ncbi:zf-HC2 domain-containing protein [Atopomonas sediminilitoris]|uniref:anti-sigma factor family protein n=1 Tax=Atopomonas sediminilitoris TaxID=2919919 RepID=UPI001F4EDA93|nr:zf-HC2 domain-containing protein [Atopomonas sediminilitoris]MCJ8170149.1 zf-HC2 domain-containing protein [Atopomonas sediminilitoris]
MLSCRELAEQASQYLDKDLSLSQQLSVRMHLLMCRHCRRFIHQLRLGQQVIRQYPEPLDERLDELAKQLAERSSKQ